MDFHMSMSDMWLEYMVARNMNSSLSWSVLPHLPLQALRLRLNHSMLSSKVVEESKF